MIWMNNIKFGKPPKNLTIYKIKFEIRTRKFEWGIYEIIAPKSNKERKD